VEPRRVGDGRWDVRIRTRLPYVQGLVLWLVLGGWLVAPLGLAMEIDPASAVVCLAAPVGLAVVAVALLARRHARRESGTIHVDAGRRRVTRSGLAALGWEALEVPAGFALVHDAYRRRRREPDVTRGASSPPRERGVDERFRLLVVEAGGRPEEAAEEVRRRLAGHEASLRARVLKAGEALKCPAGAEVVVDGSRSLALAVARALCAAGGCRVVDFTAEPAVVRGPDEPAGAGGRATSSRTTRTLPSRRARRCVAGARRRTASTSPSTRGRSAGPSCSSGRSASGSPCSGPSSGCSGAGSRSTSSPPPPAGSSPSSACGGASG